MSASRRLFVVAAALIVAAIYGVHVAHWWWINDDGFITFRYARNFVEGFGLVFNPGERVEGYSEPLYTLLVAATMALGGAPEIWGNVILIVAGAMLLALVAATGARRFGWSSPWTWLAPLLLALHRVFAAWSTSGMASQLFALFVCAGFIRVASERETGSRSHVGSFVLLGLATLTRPEGALFTAIAGAALLLDRLRGRAPWRALLIGVVPWIVLVGGHLLWRHAYYGEWLPNTYHAKVGGFYGVQGVRWLGGFFAEFELHWFLPLLLLLLRAPRRFEHGLFAIASLLHLGYLVAIGGDWHEYRFLLPLLPMWMLLLVEALARLAALGAAIGAAPAMRRGATTAALLVAGALLAQTHRASHDPVARDGVSGVSSVERLADFTGRRLRMAKPLCEAIAAGTLPSNLLIAVGAAGVVPYYTRLPTVDFFGLNDREVARQQVERRGLIGHEKVASLDYLERRGVALIEVMNNLVMRGPTEKLPREARSAPYGGMPLHCFALGGGQYLLFGTTLPAAKLRELLPALEPLF